MCLPTNITTYLPTYIHIYLHTYLPTYPYIRNFIRTVPIVPHPTFSGSHWSSFWYELKSVPVSFGTHWSPFRSVSVPIEVRFGIFVGPFWSVPFRFGRFRSVSVSRDTPIISPKQIYHLNIFLIYNNQSTTFTTSSFSWKQKSLSHEAVKTKSINSVRILQKSPQNN